MGLRLVLLIACAACGRIGFDPIAGGGDDDGSCTLSCDDGNPCTDDVCEAGTCTHAANTAPCDDGDGCTTDDRCVLSTCGPGPVTGCAGATRRIFRSVGLALTRAPVGAGSLAIVGTTAVFSTAQPDAVGVGDVISYDADGDAAPESLAFIHGRLSPQLFIVRDQKGTTPPPTSADTTQFSVARAYRTLADAVDITLGGTTNPSITAAPFDGYAGGRDLVANNEQWSFALYADGIDAPGVRICNASYTRACTTRTWTTDATRYLHIYTPTDPSEVGISQRHTGTWGTGYQRTDGIIIYEGFVRLDGLSLKRAVNGIGRSYYVETEGNGGEVWISNSFGWNTIAGASKVFDIWDTGVAALGPTYTKFMLWNDIAYNETTGDTRSGFYINSNRAEAYIYNSTAYVKGGGAFIQSSASRTTVKNCVGFSELNPAFVATTGFQLVTGSVSNDGSLTGIANGVGNQSGLAAPFADIAGADFHLGPSATSPLRGGGLDLSGDPVLPFSDDIDGEPRPAASWDVGADQLPP